jgi:hypothetical protein
MKPIKFLFCPGCGHELEDKECPACGWRVFDTMDEPERRHFVIYEPMDSDVVLDLDSDY